MALFLYTQPLCGYCKILKSKLDEIGEKYYTIDISNSWKDKKFLKDRGHTTVPQLYYDETYIDINQDSVKITVEELTEKINNAQQQDNWAWEDSGIEQVI